jgi:hypothetical protein
VREPPPGPGGNADGLAVFDANRARAVEDASGRDGRMPEAMGDDRALEVGIIAGAL